MMDSARLPLLALCLALAPASWAARPLSTEDAEPLDPGDCELESGWAQQRAPGTTRERRSLLQLGCGAWSGTQVALQWQGTHADAHSQTVTLLGKTRLAEIEDGPSYALAWGHGRGHEAGQSWQADTSYLTGVVSWPLQAALTLHGNLGWARAHSEHRDRTQWGLALEHRANEHTDVMAEVFDDDRSRQPWLQAGIRWNAVPERLWLDLSAARQTGSDGARAYAIGLRLAF